MAYPLYGSTFTLYRASPLYHGSDHVFDNLDLHARRLRETLAGDRARNLLLTDLQPEIAGTGSLKNCEWTLLGDETAWERQQEEPDSDDHVTAGNARGVHIQLRFERANYNALVLGDRPKISTTPGFTSLPLILVRMPATLRELFLDFLATTFDTRVSPMKLRSSFLTSSLEGLLQRTVPQGDDDPALDLESLSKGIGLQLSFPSATPHLKNLDLVIAKDDIRDFQSRGEQLWQQYRARNPLGKTWSTRPNSNITGPFTAALSMYLSNHIAMELDNPAIVLSKVALGTFALAGEGKIKVLTSSAAAVEFWDTLIQEAHGSGLEGMGKTPAVVQNGGTRADSRKQRLTSVPTEPPPPYELHDPARQRR
jgi:hypothetical protein